MPNPLDPRPLHDRFDLLYVRRRTWPKNAYVWLSVAAAVVTLLCLMLLSLTGDQRVYTPGEVTHAHAMFGHDCSQCHQPQPDRSGYWLPVSDQACLRCHPAGAHHPDELPAGGSATSVAERVAPVTMSSNCASCHTEHMGRDHPITLINDRLCLTCHGDLSAHRIAAVGDEAMQADAHATRTPRVHPATDAPIADRVDSFAEGGHPEFRVIDGPRIDKTLLAFGHGPHMDPDTVQMQDRLREWVEQMKHRGIPEGRMRVGYLDGGRLALTCAACHTPDDAGRYMRPIAYESHCAQCHPLGQGPFGDPVPHGRAIVPYLHAVAGRKLLEQDAASKPTSAADAAAPGPRPGPRPGPTAPTHPSTGPRPGPRPAGAAPDAAAADPPDVQMRLNSQFNELTHLQANQKCSKCHIQLIDVPRPRSAGVVERHPLDPATPLSDVDWAAIDGATVDWSRIDPSQLDWRKVDWQTINASGWSIVDPHIPDRWMPMASFSHDAHRFVSCTRCHPQATGPADESPTLGHEITPSLKATGATKQIMLPSIVECRSCHAPQVGGAVGARSNCALCHQYHNP